MELYESLFIIRPSLSDEETTALIEKMKGTVTKNGASLELAENWGRKKLAYEIKRERKGPTLTPAFTPWATYLSPIWTS